ncbi:hypothetical protein PBC5_009 [Bacillus phage PBC5]|nr:hypothetical protein PBC5_009 [Bacillus phage PBC5]
MIKNETMIHVHGEDVVMIFAQYGNGTGALELQDEYGIPHMRVTTNLQDTHIIPKALTAIKADENTHEVIAALITHDIIEPLLIEVVHVGWNTYRIYKWTPKAIRLFAEKGVIL